MSEKITFELDDKAITAEPDETIWEVAARIGVEIPHLCWQPDPGYHILATTSWLPYPGYQILVTTSWLPDPGYLILATICRFSSQGLRKLVPRSHVRGVSLGLVAR